VAHVLLQKLLESAGGGLRRDLIGPRANGHSLAAGWLRPRECHEGEQPRDAGTRPSGVSLDTESD
jgi:hypothetical protein